MNRQFRYCPTCASALVPEVHGGRMRLACSDARCDFVHWDNPTPVVGAIAERAGAVVQVRSIGWPAGWFGLITGFLEAGETPEEGVLREVQEEIGLTATTVDLVGLYPFHRMNQLLIVYHLEIPAGEIKLDTSELEDWREVPLAEIRPWASGTGYALRDWLRTRGIDFADEDLLSLERRGKE
ncbi:MAG: NUDIX domain-containing protein [Pseudomonadota bacterium]